jgi:Tfp pilus assembly pilus retraction ATPase PilT
VNNNLLAKVLHSNGLATPEQIKEHWAKASDRMDIAKVLCEAGIMTPAVYAEVMKFVASIDAGTTQAQPAPAPPPAPVPPPPVPATPPVQASPVANSPFATPAPATPPVSNRPSIRIPIPTAKPAINPTPRANSGDISEFAIEGNNTFGESFADEVAEEVRTIEGLQDTRMFDFRPTAPAPQTTPTKPAEVSKAVAAKEWTLGLGDGSARTQATMVPGPQSRLEALLLMARKQNLTDLYLTPGVAIWGRLGRNLKPLGDMVCAQTDVRRWLNEALDFAPAGLGIDRSKNLCVTIAIPGGGRFRLSVTWSSEGPAMAFRVIDLKIPGWTELGLPEFCRPWVNTRQGLILVGGPRGSGRSTTARRIAESMQEKFSCAIQVVSEPIEAIWNPGMTLHFEPHLHGLTQSQLIRGAMERGGGCLVLEGLRDSEALMLAMEAAEAGLFVVVTMDALDVVDLLERLEEFFPEKSRQRARTLLARSLRGVICQQLLPATHGERSVPAFEVLSVNFAVANLVRKRDFAQITALMVAGKNDSITMDDSLRRLRESNQGSGLI